MIVAIDGPAGSGKSTVARRLAAQLGFTYLDTGAMYRAVTLAALERDLDVNDPELMGALAHEVAIAFEPPVSGEGAPDVLLNGKKVTAAIRTPEVDQNVSAVSAVPAVREAMVAQQRSIAHDTDVVAEGRDMGTVVFPAAQVKVFLEASPEARARRRALEREGKDAQDPTAEIADQAHYQQVLEDIKTRDLKDSSREVSPLAKAADATALDSTQMTPDEVVEAIATLVADARAIEVAKAAANQHQNFQEEAVPGVGAASAATAAAAAQETKAAAKKPAKAKKPSAADTPMRAFHNTFDDYPEHAISAWPLPSRLFYQTVCTVAYGITKLYWPWQVESGETLVREIKTTKRGTVLIQNHVSMAEPVLMVLWMWKQGLPVRPVYKSEFEKNALFKWVFTRVGGIPVDRGTADLKCIRRCQRAIARGESILIYPEGTRVRDDGATAPIHGGFALIAQLGKTTVTPSAVVGVRDISPEGSKFPHPHKVWFKIGRALSFGELGVKGRKQRLDAMEKRAMARVFELRAELRQEHPGEW